MQPASRVDQYFDAVASRFQRLTFGDWKGKLFGNSMENLNVPPLYGVLDYNPSGYQYDENPERTGTELTSPFIEPSQCIRSSSFGSIVTP